MSQILNEDSSPPLFSCRCLNAQLVRILCPDYMLACTAFILGVGVKDTCEITKKKRNILLVETLESFVCKTKHSFNLAMDFDRHTLFCNECNDYIYDTELDERVIRSELLSSNITHTKHIAVYLPLYT